MRISLTEFLPTPGMVLRLRPKMCSMVRLLDFALLEVNYYRVPKVQISAEELSLFRML